ncbi:ADP-ribosylglycohydrolase family protein [Bdellovibrionota bacterium FG-1]
MLGAIIGDIVGSIYEKHNLKRTDFELLTSQNYFTDDTVLTVATAVALIDKLDYASTYRKFARAYPDLGYGPQFRDWAWHDTARPYGSLGNGSAMRVSPVAYACITLEAVLEEAAKSAQVTHNHPEGILGAQAVAGAVFLALQGASKAEIREFWTSRFPYRLNRTVDKIRKVNRFDATCDGSLPVAFACVLASESFEDCLRLAVSCGGDSNTIAAIAGSIAEPLHGIPLELQKRAFDYLPPELIKEVRRIRDR